MRVNTSLILLIVLLSGLAGCVAVSTPAVAPPSATPALPTAIPATVTPALPSGWETYRSAEQCGYTISHPSELSGTRQDRYSWLLTPEAAGPEGTVPNFIYISVIPDDFQPGGSEFIYNYDPAATQTLLSIPVGESRGVHQNADLAAWFTYTRLPDVTLGGRSAQAYENTQPWEFPTGTKEIRYYLKSNGCTYLVGGYFMAAGSDLPGGFGEQLFNQIIATFQPAD